jgi:hypothetical protein
MTVARNPAAEAARYPGHEVQIARLRARFATLERRLKVERARARSAERQLSLIGESRNRTGLQAPVPTPSEVLSGEAPGAIDTHGGEPLTGHAVLYVGGHRDVTPRLRAHVEQQGGRFLYHDGGIEMQNSRLSGLVSQADAVLCPVSRVSHDACLQLKRLCKRHGKRFVVLRSAGLSGFVSAMTHIASGRQVDARLQQK